MSDGRPSEHSLKAARKFNHGDAVGFTRPRSALWETLETYPCPLQFYDDSATAGGYCKKCVRLAAPLDRELQAQHERTAAKMIAAPRLDWSKAAGDLMRRVAAAPRPTGELE